MCVCVSTLTDVMRCLIEHQLTFPTTSDVCLVMQLDFTLSPIHHQIIKLKIIFNHITYNYFVVSTLSINDDRPPPERERNKRKYTLSWSSILFGVSTYQPSRQINLLPDLIRFKEVRLRSQSIKLIWR